MRNVFLSLVISMFSIAAHAERGGSMNNFYSTIVASSTESHRANEINYPYFRDDAKAPARGKESKDIQSKTRTYIDGISELTTDTFTPLNIAVSTPAGAGIGSINLQKRVFTETVWEFSTNDLDPEQNIFDEQGRVVLVPGRLSCRITHRETLSDYNMAGLSLGMTGVPVIPGVVNLTVNGGATFEKLKNSYWESSQSCIVGPIPAMTKASDMAKLCAPCHNAVKKTLVQDVKSRMNRLTYRVSTAICSQDSDCGEAGDDGRMITKGLIGRCLLVVDKNGSHYSECRSRALEGRSCPGTGSSGMFEYKCDRGLECVKEHEGKGFWNWSGRYDYSKYACRKQKAR